MVGGILLTNKTTKPAQGGLRGTFQSHQDDNQKRHFGAPAGFEPTPFNFGVQT